MNEETIELGGNIALTGFSALDRDNMIILKKIVGSYAKGFSEKAQEFKKLHLELKRAEPYELIATLTASDEKTVNAKDKNLFVALDNALKKIESSI